MRIHSALVPVLVVSTLLGTLGALALSQPRPSRVPFPAETHPGSGSALPAVLEAPPDPQVEPGTQVPEAREPDLESVLLAAAPGLPAEALRGGLEAWQRLSAAEEATRPVLTIIDYALPSTEKRLWVLDLEAKRLLFHELVAHGRNTGDNLARNFSNETETLKTSLGAFVTGGTYIGKNGYSMRLRGMDPGINDRAEARTIVVHGAPYVSEATLRALGRLGRSHGCPAVRREIARPLIDTIRNGSVLYAWFAPSDPGPTTSLSSLR